jgi:hypothetical protein
MQSDSTIAGINITMSSDQPMETLTNPSDEAQVPQNPL